MSGSTAHSMYSGTKLPRRASFGTMAPVSGEASMNADNLDIRLLRYRSRRDESPHALAQSLLEAARPREALEVIRLALVDQAPDARLLVLEGRAWFDQSALPEAQDALM